MRSRLESVAQWCESYLVWVLVVGAMLGTLAFDSLFPAGSNTRPHAERAQVDSIITVVVIGVVAIIGILVYSQVEGSISGLDITGARNDPANATVLENASASVGGGFGDAIELVPIVMIVLIAALVIGVIQRFRS